MKLRREGQSGELDIELLERDGDTIRVRAGDREIVAEAQPLAGGGAILTIGGRRFAVAGARRNSSILVAVGPRNFEFKQAEQGARRRHGGLAAPEITAPMPGKVLKILVKAGDAVVAGQPLVVIEAMKMETTLAAESAAIVGQVRVEPGQMVDHGAVLIELRPPSQ
jgi:biotin carboxyl carrier protein